MPRNRTLLGYLLVITAALCWATLGVFYTVAVKAFGLSPLTVVTYRTLLAALMLGGVLAWRGGATLRVRREHVRLFVAYVLFGIVIFYIAYVYAILLTGVAVAAVLLYTAPAWVALIARLALGEPLTPRVGIALGLTWVGVILVAQAYNLEHVRLNFWGILAGLVSGLTYGLYSVFQKVAVRHYRPWAVQWHGLFWGGLLIALLQPPEALLAPIRQPAVLPWLLGLALLPTLGGGLAYTVGVQWIPVSVASIVATLEPVAATVFGYVFLNERLEPPQWIGGMGILVAVWLLRPRDEAAREPEARTPAQATAGAAEPGQG